jgi:hypothetical protein
MKINCHGSSLSPCSHSSYSACEQSQDVVEDLLDGWRIGEAWPSRLGPRRRGCTLKQDMWGTGGRNRGRPGGTESVVRPWIPRARGDWKCCRTLDSVIPRASPRWPPQGARWPRHPPPPSLPSGSTFSRRRLVGTRAPSHFFHAVLCTA